MPLKSRIYIVLCDLRRFFYKLIYNIKIDVDHSLLPNVGKGKYVSIYRKGDYIDVVDESSGDFIRMIPYQPNHGYMVERWKNNRITSRTHLAYEDLIRIADGFVEGL